MGEREELLALAQIIDGRPTQYAEGGFAVEDSAPASDQALLKAGKILGYLGHAQGSFSRDTVRQAIKYLRDIEGHMMEHDIDTLMGDYMPPSIIADRLEAALRAPEADADFCCPACGNDMRRPPTHKDGCDFVAFMEAKRAPEAAITTDLMNGATVSCSGNDITIACDNHDTKDAIMNALTFSRAPEAADAGAVGIDRLCDFIEETQERLGPGCDELALAEAIVAKFNVRDLTGKGASPAADAGMRERAAAIEECAKLIESGAGMADLIDQEELDQQAAYIRALAPTSTDGNTTTDGVSS